MSSSHYPDQSAGPCAVCGRALDSCGTCVCLGWDMGSENRCGVEGTRKAKSPQPPRPTLHRGQRDGIQKRGQVGIKPDRRFSEPASCPDCDGRGWVETHICMDSRHCDHMGPACPRRETCMGCLGRGVTNGS